MAKGDLTIVLDKKDYERVVRTLDKAADVDTSQAVQKGLREGARDMMNAGKANLAQRNKVKTGNLRKSFAIKVTRRKKIGSNYALTGFKRSTRFNQVKGGNHSYLVDKGTAKRWTRKGAYRGSVSKNSPNTGSGFFTDAVQTEGPKALNRIVDIIENELNKLMK